jgi:ABC-type nickel/cobalt efflux system permease component RcnA
MRSIVLILLMLWLPLQGVAAAVMPFCKHQAGAAAHQAADQHVHHGHHHGDEPDTASQSFACDDCGTCHLACTPGVPVSATTLGLPRKAELAAFDPSPPIRHIPEQPKRPPLARV